MADNCLFCKIAKGEIPAAKVYEDDATVVFKDIGPKAPVHLLAIPREHFDAVHNVPAAKMALMGRLLETVAKVVKQEQLTAKGYRLVINSGADAGQAVPHIHVHILAGRTLAWPPG
jgi:histidine triad (HIT) family protein